MSKHPGERSLEDRISRLERLFVLERDIEGRRQNVYTSFDGRDAKLNAMIGERDQILRLLKEGPG